MKSLYFVKLLGPFERASILGKLRKADKSLKILGSGHEHSHDENYPYYGVASYTTENYSLLKKAVQSFNGSVGLDVDMKRYVRQNRERVVAETQLRHKSTRDARNVARQEHPQRCSICGLGPADSCCKQSRGYQD